MTTPWRQTHRLAAPPTASRRGAGPKMFRQHPADQPHTAHVAAPIPRAAPHLLPKRKPIPKIHSLSVMGDQPVRLRVRMVDADLYSLRFGEAQSPTGG